jgi:hypothetical protein
MRPGVFAAYTRSSPGFSSMSAFARPWSLASVVIGAAQEPILYQAHLNTHLKACTSSEPQRLERRLPHIPEEHRVDLLQDVRVHLQELALVLNRDQRALAAVVHGNLEGLGQ